MIGNCKLCQENKDLQKVCHVIPEFFYRDSKLYHEDHNLKFIDLKLFLSTGEKRFISYKQKTGEFEKYMLCPNCDGTIIGNYETYGREFLYSNNLSKGKELKLKFNIDNIECINADYKKLKLLYLSILWRASISSRPLFSEINLREDKEEELRLMILHDNPKTDIEFPIFVMNTIFDKTITKDFLFHPIKIRLGDEDGFVFAFGGFIYTIIFGIKGISDKLLDFRIKENGTFKSYNIPNGKTWELINNFYKN
jgi:hypothetical protein